MKKRFRVVRVSTNTCKFGLKRHLLVAEDGTAIEADRQPSSILPGMKDLREGDDLTFSCGEDGFPNNWAVEHQFGFVHPAPQGKMPPNLVAILFSSNFAATAPVTNRDPHAVNG